MKRSVASLALLVTVWSQLAALGCEMQSVAHEHGARGSDGFVTGTAHPDEMASHGHDTGHHARAEQDAGLAKTPPAGTATAGSHDHGGPTTGDCGLLMTCGATAVEGDALGAGTAPMPLLAEARVRASAPVIRRTPATDPPPPRARS
jgi:hypothetical protein